MKKKVDFFVLYLDSYVAFYVEYELEVCKWKKKDK